MTQQYRCFSLKRSSDLVAMRKLKGFFFIFPFKHYVDIFRFKASVMNFYSCPFILFYGLCLVIA